MLRFLSKIDSPIILEAGAADGADTLRFARLLSSRGGIYAFEPVLQNFERLRKLVKDQHNVYAFRMALGDYDGKTEMVISRNIEADDNIASSSS